MLDYDISECEQNVREGLFRNIRLLFIREQ